MNRILLGGGCFWGVEAYYKQLKGVIDTKVGYANGNYPNPKYEDLKKHKATHVEAVEIKYDPKLISLEKLLEHFFRFVDPFALNKQGEDEGIQYRSGIYYNHEEDLKIIKKFIEKEQKKYHQPIVIEVLKEQGFYLAEDYHQDYLVKNPNGYCHVNLKLVKKEERK
jgi:peptide-methionine (S)-S-oxide reductase